MLDPKESRFWQATLLSGLMDAPGLTACWNAITPGKRDDPEHINRRLARQAVQARALTLWQAQQLMAGRTSGFKVDRYVLLDLIGQGGMGRVYLALDTRLNRQVALKILSPERINNPRAIARFQREARVGAQLQHENLVRIYDFGESSGRYYLVMEYIEGKTIGTLISEQGAIPPSTAVNLVRQVAMGLEHAHRKGLIHRDVNPYNILVTRDGTAKLADLGLAIDLAEEDRVTCEGATVGTFDYVAPEQARHSHSADIRSDIYSLGCSLYHMCTGQVPFPTPSLPEKLFAHQAMEPTPVEKLVPDLPEGLSEIIQRMMHKSPEERYATPLQVAQALEVFADDDSSDDHQDNVQLMIPGAAAISPSARPVEAQAALLKPGVESSAAVAESVGLKTPPDPALVPDTRPSATVAPTVFSPHTSQSSDPEFPVNLILSPEPSLTAGLSRPKPRSGPSNSVTSSEGTTPVRLPRPWLWGLIVITIAMLLIVVVLAVVNPLGDTTGNPKIRPSSPSTKTTKSLQLSTEATHPASDGQKPSPPIVVRSEGENDQGFPADKLYNAINTAMGRRGSVELRNREPLRLTGTGNKPLDFRSARRDLIIRAASGIEPVIEIDLNSSTPLLETGSSVSLTLSGVTFVVHYPQSGASSSSAPPALITMAGISRIERCAFKVASGPQPRGCRALFSNMGALTVDRCWFQGFDKAIDVAADYRTRIRISQTMIVATSGRHAAQAETGEWYGWGVKIQFAGAKRPQNRTAQPNLILDHCTFEGAGLFDLTSSLDPAQLQVEVKRCALHANALLAFNPKSLSTEHIHWQGDANQYNIHGRTWIVHSASEGSPALSASVTDLESWLRATPDEKNTIRTKLKYQVDPATRSDSLQPSDFAIEAPGPPKSHPGAEPGLVGPWNNP